MKKIEIQNQCNRKKVLTILQARENFFRNCRLKNLSEETITSYRYKTKRLLDFFGEDSPVTDITKDKFDDFILCLRDDDKINDITVNTNIRNARAFLYFCMENGYIGSFKISLIKAEKKIKETYTDEELKMLLKKPNMNTCKFTEYKIWVFENFLLGTGVRIRTALNIKVKDIDFDNAVVILRKTKNRNEQIIPLSKTLSVVLTEYLKIRGNDSEAYLFCSAYGLQGDKRTYQEYVAKYNASRGVSKTSCHLFRHTFAKKCVMEGMDVFRLQKIMGHANLSTTQNYVAMFGKDLSRDFEKYNPLDVICQTQKKEKIKIKF